MKYTNTLMVGLLFAVMAVFVAPNVTFAACSDNGYYHSKGKCDVSRKYDRSHSYSFFSQYDDRRFDALTRYIEQLQEMIKRLEEQRDRINWYDDEDSEVDVSTRSAIDIDTDEAKLRGYLDLNDSDEAEVWFEYGTSRSDLDDDTNEKTLDENDDFSMTIDDLDEDTRYYFRAVAEDEDGERDYGSILSFVTGDGDDDEPTATTYSATNIDEDSARLRGYVNMNDFNNGEVFFVYGENEDEIDDVESDFDSYSDVDEDGDDLQKERVDSDLDSSESYTETVTGLDDNTDIYYRICVGYEDEDDDKVLECGQVRNFETD